jgi:hypothetical protein
MSVLSPLYLLGLLAVAAPIVFHLIRRSPRGEIPFSSLLFLSASPPRLTRRNRLDQLLLLFLRALALCLLALAFSRPFLRQEARWNLEEEPQRRVALLIDTSASMRRGNLWSRAKDLARQAARDCGPVDDLAVLAFDTTTHPVLTFSEAASLEPSRRAAVVLDRINRLEPSWGATNLGQALVDAAAAIEDVADTSERTGRMPRRIVLVSDLQQGSHLDVLGELEWPFDVELELKTVSGGDSNAGLHRLADADAGPADPPAPRRAAGNTPRPQAGERRVRVFNDPSSQHEKFELRWIGAPGSSIGPPIDVYVPPGESRVVPVPPPPGTAAPAALVLTGDAEPFDNTLHIADEHKEEATVLYLGNDREDDSTGLLYYLSRVFLNTERRSVQYLALRPDARLNLESDRSIALAIVTAEVGPESIRRLESYARAGGTLMYVATRPGRSETLGALAKVAPPAIEEAAGSRDVMLGEIAFDHRLFAPLAGAQYSDFTKIHFWKYRRLPANALGESRVLARFENGDPAVVEKPLDRGRLIVLASGWSPADSQLARSSKFVPLMSALVDLRDARPVGGPNHTVGDRVALPSAKDPGAAIVVHKPDGTLVSLPAGSTSFSTTDQPGVYTIDTPDGPRPFAVNLDPAESRVSPLSVETLEQLGCRLVNPTKKLVDREQLRQMHNAELESRQKLWRWLILLAIGVLIVETYVAGRIKRPRLAPAEAQST